MRLIMLVMGIAIGLAIGAPAFGIYWDFAISGLERHAILLVSSLLFATILMLVIFTLGRRVLLRLMGVKDFSAKEIADRANEVIWSVVDGDREELQHRSGELLRQSAALITFTQFYKWMFGVLLTIIVGLGGALGTIVLLKQNEKIGEQTKVLERQREIAEEELTTTRTAELDRIAEALKSFSTSLTDSDRSNLYAVFNRCRDISENTRPSPELNQNLVFRITTVQNRIALALSTAQTSRQHHRILRSQVFRMIVQSGMPLAAFDASSIQRIDAANRVFVRPDISSFDAKESNWSGARFVGPCIYYSNLTRSSFKYASFEQAKLSSVNFAESDLSDATFENSTIDGGGVRLGLSYDGLKPPRDIKALRLRAGLQAKQRLQSAETWWQWLLEHVSRFGAYFQGANAKAFDGPIDGLPRRSDHTDPDRFVKTRTGSFIMALMPEVSFVGGSVTSTSFALANMQRAQFVETRFESVTFRGADLSGSRFPGALIRGDMSFANANMTDVDFRLDRKSDLSGALFEGASMKRTLVDGLDFGSNKSLQLRQLQQACVASDNYPRWQGKTIKLKKCPDPNDAPQGQ